MPRDPFVWEVQVRREILEDEVSKLRELPYSLWRGMLSREMTKTATGRDNRPYRVRVTAEWLREGSDDIRITAVLESPGFRRGLMRQGFVITPDNRVND